jgi:hypothetical protein
MRGKRTILGVVLALVALMGSARPFAAADSAEFPFKLGAVLSPPGKYPTAKPAAGVRLQSLPSMVDLAADLPPVDTQGHQSSCVAWSVGYYYKSFQERQERGWDLAAPEHRFSPAFIYNQRWTSDCGDDGGMSVPNAMSILVEKGELSLAEFPYDPDDSCALPTEQQLAQAQAYKAASYAAVFVGQGWADLNALKQHLAAGDPFVIAVPIYPSFLATCDDPVVDSPGLGETWYGAHAVLVVGYDDAVGGFRFVNSWGPNYGCEGFAYLSYEFVQRYAYEAWKMYDEMVAVNEPPSVGSVDPGSGTNDPGEAVQFTASYSDPNGWEDISTVRFRIGDGDPAHSVVLKYSIEDGLIWLRDEDDTCWLGGLRIGTDATIVNSRVVVDLSSSSVSGLGHTLFVCWSVQFTDSHLGPHASCLKATDSTGLSTGWIEVGQWSVGQTAELELVRGWNLISLPVILPCTNVAEVFSSIEGYYDAIQAYDGHDSQDQWSCYSVGVPEFANTLEQIDETMGLWISMTDTATLSLLGSRPKGVDIALHAGWNMVGYPLQESLGVAQALAGIGEQLTMVRWYDPSDSEDPWKTYDPIAPAWANDLTEMQPGRGYWIAVDQDCVWTTGVS